MYKNNTLSLATGQAYFNNWRKLSPMDNAILRVIETHGGEIRQSEIASILGVNDIPSISKRITRLAELGLVTVTKYGRQNSYVTIFFGQTVGQQLDSETNNWRKIQSVNKQTTTEYIKPEKVKSSKRQITETDYDNAKVFSIQVEAPTCAKGRQSLDDALRSRKGYRVSSTLQTWRNAYDSGDLDLTGSNGDPMTPCLIAAKIIECQEPPTIPSPVSPSGLVELGHSSLADSVECIPGPEMPQDSARFQPDFSQVTEDPTTGDDTACHDILDQLQNNTQFGRLFIGANISQDNEKLVIALSKHCADEYNVKKYLHKPVQRLILGFGLEMKGQRYA